MKKKNRKPRICLVSSSGGHFEQLLRLRDLNEDFEIYIVTEKTKYNKTDKKIDYYLPQVNRKEFFFFLKMIIISLKSFLIFCKEKPDVIISTGVLATIPMIYFGHFFKKKVIYIESFAKIGSPTKTGSLIYKKNWANQFYVQWESMLKFYPKAIYKGGIY